MSKFINDDFIEQGTTYEDTVLDQDILTAENLAQEDSTLGAIVHDIMSEINTPDSNSVDKLLSEVGIMSEGGGLPQGGPPLPVGAGATPLQGMGPGGGAPQVGGAVPGASPFPPMKGPQAPRPQMPMQGGPGGPPRPGGAMPKGPMPGGPGGPAGPGGKPPMPRKGSPAPRPPGGPGRPMPAMPPQGPGGRPMPPQRPGGPGRPGMPMPPMQQPQSPNADMGGLYGRRNQLFPNKPRR